MQFHGSFAPISSESSRPFSQNARFRKWEQRKADVARVTCRYDDRLPAWIEIGVRLPAGTAEPGPIKLYAYQRRIAAA